VLIRTFSDADLARVAEIAKANDEPDGQNPAYLRHLRESGRFLVAERDGTVAGYAATHQVGAAAMLSDLFIALECRDTGIGGRLLAAVFADAGERFTFASKDPRAMPLYARYGMRPRWPLLYMSGSAMPASSLDCERVPSTEAARVELALTGIDRAAEYAFWATGLIVRDAEGIVGAGAASPGRLIHFVTAEGSDPVAGLGTALAAVPADPVPGGRIGLCLPGPHPALKNLLETGWRITDYDHHMSTSDRLVDPNSVVSPSLG
jgi:GNAT superfamily N-acetyltransferase